MATKRKATKKTTKKDLEAKIAELEAKLANISGQVSGEAKAKQAPPPPKQTQQAPPPKPQEKAAPPATLAQAMEDGWRNYPAGNSTHWYKEHTTGFSPAPNRYYGRLIAPVGKAPTQDWNLQKAKVTGYTQPSNQYFASRARLAYHPAATNFSGYNMSVEGVAAQAETQQAPPPPPPPQPKSDTLPKGSASSGGGSSKKSDLEAYEQEYLARLDREERENAELMKAAQELAAKRAAESGGSSGQAGSSKGTLPKGF